MTHHSYGLDDALGEHGSILVLPFLHGLGKDPPRGTQKVLEQLFQSWSPWWFRSSSRQLPFATTRWFHTAVSRTLYPEFGPNQGSFKAEVDLLESPNNLAEFYTRNCCSPNELETIHLTWKPCFTAGESGLPLSVGTEQNPENTILIAVNWIDLYLFPRKIGFLAIRIALREDPPRLSQLIHVHQLIRDLDRPEVFLLYNGGEKITISQFVEHLTEAVPFLGERPDSRLPTPRFKIFSWVTVNWGAETEYLQSIDDYYPCSRWDGVLYEYGTCSSLGTLKSDPTWMPSREYLQEEMLKNLSVNLWRYWRGLCLRDMAVFISLAEKRPADAVRFEDLFFPVYLYTYHLKQQLTGFSQDFNIHRSETRAIAWDIVGQFMQFRNEFWFSELSPNFQLCYLFDRLKQGMEVEKDYQNVCQEMSEVGSFLQDQHNQKLSQLNAEINRITFWLKALATCAAIFGLILGIWRTGAPIPFLGATGASGLVLGFLWLVWRYWRKK